MGKDTRKPDFCDDWPEFRQHLFRIVSIGVVDDIPSRAYDMINVGAVVANLAASICLTFSVLEARFGNILQAVEAVTVFFFAVDYVLRLLTAGCLHRGMPEGKALRRYIFSFSGIIDLLSFLPYYLPVFFPAGMTAFRMFRVIRIFRLFRINAYYDSLNVITEVLASKKQQLLSSVFIILVLMLASSLCMYSVEHEAQPDVFSNAFSGIWWSASTLLTVGYGDIYPVTTMGKLLGTVIAFLGVGMVAIPTGIISAGFVEQYSQFKRFGDYSVEERIRFIQVKLSRKDAWTGRQIREAGLPQGILIAAIQRDGEILIPRGDTVLKDKDMLIIGAESHQGDTPVELREVLLGKKHEWNGQMIRDLDISRQTLIVLVRRQGTMLVPHGDLILKSGDEVLLYQKPRKSVSVVS